MDRPSVDELRALVDREIPYRQGQGTYIINRRAARLRELMHAFDYPTQPPRSEWSTTGGQRYSNQHPSRDAG